MKTPDLQALSSPPWPTARPPRWRRRSRARSRGMSSPSASRPRPMSAGSAARISIPILPAPESAHAVRVAIDEALRARESGEKKVIAFNLSGHGHFDMSAYEQFHQGKLQDH